MYFTLKTIHATCAVISIGGFLLRWLLALAASPIMARRWVRVLPHFNDTLLLAAAAALALMSGQYPLQQPWLTTKVALLVIYVLLGKMALAPNAPAKRCAIAGVGALTTVGLLLATALTRIPLGFIDGSG